jgi:hypothetical protein
MTFAADRPAFSTSCPEASKAGTKESCMRFGLPLQNSETWLKLAVQEVTKPLGWKFRALDMDATGAKRVTRSEIKRSKCFPREWL